MLLAIMKSEVIKGGGFWRVLRFLCAGGFNTVISFGLYVILLRFFSYIVAYTISYFFGIVISYFVSVRFVFRGKGGLLKFLFYPLIYGLQYVVGVLLLSYIVRGWGVPDTWAPLFVVVLTLPMTYVLTYILLNPRRINRHSAKW